MRGQQRRMESLFYYFRLQDQIPEDHLLSSACQPCRPFPLNGNT
jgi:hypothetical protein